MKRPLETDINKPCSSSKKLVQSDDDISSEKDLSNSKIYRMSDYHHKGSCCHHDGHEDDDNLSPEMQEVLAAEKVINAFFYFKQLGTEKVLSTLGHLRDLPTSHQKLIAETYANHTREAVRLIKLDADVLKKMVTVGACSLGEDTFKALKMTQLRRPDATYCSKVTSTIRQIVREWSKEGESDRNTTFGPIVQALQERFPDLEKRHEVRIYVPGCGLGRLPWDLIQEGFSVIGNEYSMFMLITSCFLLNGCKEANEFTLHPYLFEKSNSWSFSDQLRPITFPDICPSAGNGERKNEFAMCAGNFLEITRDDINHWDSVVTAWFIDTANNVIEYIERIYQMLKPGGIWVNVGPLTYHYEDTEGEMSIELPYEELRKIIESTGFEISNEKKINARYTWNSLSMLHNKYCCAFFVATKKEK